MITRLALFFFNGAGVPSGQFSGYVTNPSLWAFTGFSPYGTVSTRSFTGFVTQSGLWAWNGWSPTSSVTPVSTKPSRSHKNEKRRIDWTIPFDPTEIKVLAKIEKKSTNLLHSLKSLINDLTQEKLKLDAAQEAKMQRILEIIDLFDEDEYEKVVTYKLVKRKK